MQDIPEAQFNLGKCYEDGDGVPQDFEKAHEQVCVCMSISLRVCTFVSSSFLFVYLSSHAFQPLSICRCKEALYVTSFCGVCALCAATRMVVLCFPGKCASWCLQNNESPACAHILASQYLHRNPFKRSYKEAMFVSSITCARVFGVQELGKRSGDAPL